jgi:uncharacterized flavoprotein (TIGR03862 family)
LGVDGQHRRVVSAARDIIVVGAGPAGLFAAERLAGAGHRVTVYERMPAPARKFLLAGRGGLNLTHSEPLEGFLARYGDAGAGRIRNAVRDFPPQALVDWANALGAETFVGSSGRVFPKAMKASPLLRAWLRRLNALGVALETRRTWTGFVDAGGDSQSPALSFLDADRHDIQVCADAVVLALGGASWPRLGSDGAWLGPFAAAGIDVAPLAPSNCGVNVDWSEAFKSRFAGHPLKRVLVRAGGASRRGEAMITSAGLEGVVIYALGPAIRQSLGTDSAAALQIDLRPDIDEATLNARLSRPRGGQSLSTFLRKSLRLDPQAIALLREVEIPAEPERLAALIKSVPVTVEGLAGLDRAISTAGGVAASAIDDTWMLKRRPGVFVAGEMVDWDAPTGGFLLQGAFASGGAAAEGVLRWLAQRSRG